jgi:hypothetical protein
MEDKTGPCEEKSSSDDDDDNPGNSSVANKGKLGGGPQKLDNVISSKSAK